MTISGVLNVNKPRGKTSFDVVALVRRWSGERRVGHAGTLDPEASGVLVVCLGQATRIIEFLADLRKSYRAEIELGVATDTYDAEGKVMLRGDLSSLTRKRVEAGLESFRGAIEQLPPMFSAVKHEGKPLYHLARAGVEVPREKRMVEVYHLELVEWNPPLVTIELECSKGTYVRSLAHDLGLMLGCGAHVKRLVRLSSGPFQIGDSIALADLEEAFKLQDLSQFLQPMDSAIAHLPVITLDETSGAAVTHGRPLILPESGLPGEHRRARSPDGRLLAILRYDAELGYWHPRKVFVGAQ